MNRFLVWWGLLLVTHFEVLAQIGPNPPNQPTLISPQHLSTGISTSPQLSVTVSDPEADRLSVTFYGRAAAANPGPDFTLVALPDAQYYTAGIFGGSPTIFHSQTQWCVDNKTSRNIVFVSQLGDITEHGDQSFAEWQNADAAMSRLESPSPGIPYGIAVGNHDETGGTTYYNQVFGISRFASRSYYGGHYGTDNNNNFELFSASGLDFIVVNLGLTDKPTPDANILSWADQVLKTYNARRAIVVNHNLIDPGNPGPWSGPGQAIYDALKNNPNLFLMLCGHWDGEGMRTDVGPNGNTIYTLLSDYQERRPNGGNGWMRIMEFSPANNEIRVKTYSPWLNQWETDANSQFSLNYNMQAASFQVIGTNSNVASGSNASITWPGLSASTQYEWYVTASDGSRTTIGSTWRFTTLASSSTSLVSSANPSLSGQSVTFRASVSPVDATGTVQFVIDGQNMGAPVQLVSGSATSGSISSLTAGTHDVTAVYSGDTRYSGSISQPVAQIVIASSPGGEQDVTGQGTCIALITSPRGQGNRNLEVIRDGVFPPVGSTNAMQQYDTYTGDATRTFDWIGYQFTGSHNFVKLTFQEGRDWGDGGWFTDLRVQVRVAGVWTDVQGMVSTPAYGGHNSVHYETYTLTFSPLTGDGIRIAGTPGGSARFISVGELRAIETPQTSIASGSGGNGTVESWYNVDPDWGRIILRDNSGESVTLYAATAVTNLGGNELSPVPPVGVFDARYSTGRTVEDLGTTGRDILISSSNYPITLLVVGMTVSVTDRLNKTYVNQLLKDGETITITDRSISVLGVKKASIPLSHRLAQNYPNPFNPATQIEYAIPTDAMVTLRVFDLLGQEIATLVNQWQSAGSYVSTWDASIAPSGVYFYRLDAGSFSQAKKMILLK